MKKKIFLAIFLALIIFIGIFYFLKENRDIISSDQKETVAKSEGIRFGFMTDIHCYSKQNKELGQWELNWRCERPMNAFVDTLGFNSEVDFLIEGGDFIDGRDDRSVETFSSLKKLYDKATVPKYHVMGNHETRGFSKDKWLELTGHDKAYYFFDIKDYRLIVLDANFFLDVDNLKKDTSPEVESYSGRINEDQYSWLEKVLGEAKDKNKIVFVHQPPIKSTTIKNGGVFSERDRLGKILSENNVLAVFSGHIEEMCSLEYDKVSYFSLKGVHKANRQLPVEHQLKDKGLFYEIRIDENKKINIEMYWREPNEEKYQKKLLEKSDFICNNESALLSF